VPERARGLHPLRAVDERALRRVDVRLVRHALCLDAHGPVLGDVDALLLQAARGVVRDERAGAVEWELTSVLWWRRSR
jgi:hypothetical protein